MLYSSCFSFVRLCEAAAREASSAEGHLTVAVVVQNVLQVSVDASGTGEINLVTLWTLP